MAVVLDWRYLSSRMPSSLHVDNGRQWCEKNGERTIRDDDDVCAHNEQNERAYRMRVCVRVGLYFF